MAGSTPFVLPQYQGSLYDLQRQQALANALMQNSMTQPQAPQAGASGNYQVAARMSPLAPLSNLAQGLAGHYLGQQVGQGMNQLGLQQQQVLMGTNGNGMGAMSGAMSGGATSPLQQPPAGQPGAAAAGTAGGADANDGASGVPNQLSQGQPAQQGTPGLLEPGGPMNPLGMPKQQAMMMLMQAPDKYWEAQAAAYKPSDIVASIRAAGIDPSSTLGHQLAQQALAKANYIAPTSLRAGGYMYDPSTGQTQQMPNVPEGFTAQRGQNGQWQIVPVQGGTEAMSQSAAAKAGGQAQYQLHEVWDPTANNGQGGFVQQSVANVANAANGGGSPNAPMGIRNNNPGNLRPGGNFAQYPDMQTGLAALDKNLQSYGSQGVNTVAGVISKWAPPNENDTNGYIKEVSQRLGIQPNQKIDLSNPLVRQSLSTAIALRENGPQGVFGGGGKAPAAQGGPMASQPPLGATNAANASQGAPSKQMADSYGAMSTADANYQQSREALNEMLGLANGKGAAGAAIGVLPEGVSTRISPDAAKYQKLHATYVALQGKALGSGGTDAARATIDEAVPTYDKPQSAMVSGLQTQLANLDMSHLKTQFLTPLYQQGNEKTYTTQSAAFDNNIKPSMIGALQLSGDAQRAAVQQAIKANPSLRSNFEWAYNNGMLK